jgi:hypothetical protein
MQSGAASSRERERVWLATSYRDCYACTECSWTYSNPLILTEQQHDAAQVRQRFDEHICNQHIPLKKFNWG